MNHNRPWLILGSVIWLGIAAAVYADYYRAAVAVETSLEAGRKWHRDHPDETESSHLETIYWSPRINTRLIVPLMAAAALTVGGYWKTGCMFGGPAVAAAAWMLWDWYTHYRGILHLVNP